MPHQTHTQEVIDATVAALLAAQEAGNTDHASELEAFLNTNTDTQ